MNTEFDPLHVMDELDDSGVYVEVHKCETCGVVGTMFYRSRHEPCPRCGETRAPTRYVAMWVTMTKVHRVPLKWWRPSTWQPRHEITGAWIPRNQGVTQ